MKKRILAMLLIAVLLVGFFTACGEKESTDPSAMNQTYTVTLAHDLEGKPLEVLNTYIDLFTKTFPHIEVTAVSAAELPEGETPDVLYCLPDRVAELAADKKLVALDALVESDALMSRSDGALAPMGISSDNLADIFEHYYQEGFIDGKLYTMPIAKTAQILYYNQTFFEENMLDSPLSWERVEAACVAIKELDPESIPLCIEDPADFFITMCAQESGDYTSESGDHFLFNNETNRAFVKKFNDWYQKGYITTRTLLGREEAGAMLAEDTRHYMALGSSAYANAQQLTENEESYAFELGIFAFPQQGYDNQKVLARGPGLCIFNSKDDEQINCAWMLVKFLSTNTEFQSKFAQAASLLPVLISAELEDSYSDYLDHADGASNAAAFAALSCMEQQHALFTAPAFDGSANAYEQVGLLLDKCLTITGSDVDAQIEKAFEEAVKACK